MKTEFISVLLLFFYCSTFGVVINYNWEVGESYRYAVQTRADYISSRSSQRMKILNVASFYIDSQFEIEVKDIDNSGLIYAQLNLLNFEVKSSKGKTIGALYHIPSKAFSTSITIDQFGEFSVQRKVQLVVTDEIHYLVKNEKQISPEDLQSKTDLMAYMQFSSANRNLNQDYEMKDVHKGVKINVPINDENPIIDLIPYKYLRLFVIPVNSIETDESFVDVKKDYKVLTTAEMIGTDKAYFSSSLIKNTVQIGDSINLDSEIYGSIESMSTSQLFDFENGILLSMKGSYTQKQSRPHMATQLKQVTKILFIKSK